MDKSTERDKPPEPPKRPTPDKPAPPPDDDEKPDADEDVDQAREKSERVPFATVKIGDTVGFEGRVVNVHADTHIIEVDVEGASYGGDGLHADSPQFRGAARMGFGAAALLSRRAGTSDAAQHADSPAMRMPAAQGDPDAQRQVEENNREAQRQAQRQAANQGERRAGP